MWRHLGAGALPRTNSLSVFVNSYEHSPFCEFYLSVSRKHSVLTQPLLDYHVVCPRTHICALRQRSTVGHVPSTLANEVTGFARSVDAYATTVNDVIFRITFIRLLMWYDCPNLSDWHTDLFHTCFCRQENMLSPTVGIDIDGYWFSFWIELSQFQNDRTR